MAVQVAFQRSDGSLVHRLIVFFTKSEWAHCEVVVNGHGYAMKGETDGLFIRPPGQYQNALWELIEVSWSVSEVMEYIKAHAGTKYDKKSLLTGILPFVRDNHLKQNCSEFIGKIGAYCNDPIFHGMDASRLTPGEIYQLLNNRKANHGTVQSV